MAGDTTSAVLRDLLITTKDGDWGKESPEEGFVPYRVIRGTDFPGVRTGDSRAVPLRYLSEATVQRRTLMPDDILLETAGGSPGRPTGRSLLITEKLLSSLDLPATCASFARFLRVDRSRADPRYVYWHLQYLYASGQMEEHQVQHTGVARFQYTKFAESERIPLPTPNEQRAIAHILSTLDDKIELNRRMNQTLEAMAQALFKSWFVDFDPVRAKAEGRDPGLPSDVADLFPDSFEDSELGEIPKGWALRTLGSVCEQPQYGYTASASDEAIGPRFLRITDINKENWIKWDEVPFCSIEAAEQKKYALRPGDVIIARMADPGHGALIEDAVDAVFASYLIRFRPHERPFGRYLQYWLRSKMYWELVLSRQSGTTRANLNARVLSEFPLVVPDHLIRGAFAEEAEVLRSRVAANVRETAVLAAVRNALLPKLISGELRLKGAERSIGGKDT